MTPSALQTLARQNRDIENAKAATDFARLAQFILRNDGRLSKAAIAAAASSRAGMLGPSLASIVKNGASGISREVLQHEKAAVVAGGLSGGSALADYSIISQGFINSLVTAGAFDFMIPSMVPLPFVGTGTLGSVTIGAQAYSISEGSAKPISRLTIVNQQMNPLKAVCAIPFTQELVRSAFIGATMLIQREMQNAVATVTDQVFINAITSGITPITSSGSTGESIRSDIAGMLRSIGTGQNSKLFLLVPSLVCRMWSMASNQKGQSAFEDLGPTGGEINKIPVIATDGAGPTSGLAVLVDAGGIGAAPGEIEIQEMKDASINFDSAPDSPAAPSTNYASMFQLNQVMVVTERFFNAVRIRPDAVATTLNANSWQGGNSPP